MVRLLVFIKQTSFPRFLFSGRLLAVFISLVLISGCSLMKKESPAEIKSPVESTPAEAVLSVQNQTLFKQSIQAMQAGQYKQAVVSLNKVSSSQPKLAAPYINLAISYRYLKDMEKAQTAIRQALRNAPDSPEAHNVQGILQREAGLFKEARKSYEKSIKLDSNSAASHLNLAILCDLYLKNLDCAMNSYKNYQAKGGSDDKRLKGWLADLKRRIKKGKS